MLNYKVWITKGFANVLRDMKYTKQQVTLPGRVQKSDI